MRFISICSIYSSCFNMLFALLARYNSFLMRQKVSQSYLILSIYLPWRPYNIFHLIRPCSYSAARLIVLWIACNRTIFPEWMHWRMPAPYTTFAVVFELTHATILPISYYCVPGSNFLPIFPNTVTNNTYIHGWKDNIAVSKLCCKMNNLSTSFTAAERVCSDCDYEMWGVN